MTKSTYCVILLTIHPSCHVIGSEDFAGDAVSLGVEVKSVEMGIWGYQGVVAWVSAIILPPKVPIECLIQED